MSDKLQGLSESCGDHLKIEWSRYKRPKNVGMTDWFDGTVFEVPKEFEHYDETIVTYETDEVIKTYGVKDNKFKKLNEIFTNNGEDTLLEYVINNFVLISEHVK